MSPTVRFLSYLCGFHAIYLFIFDSESPGSFGGRLLFPPPADVPNNNGSTSISEMSNGRLRALLVSQTE